MSDTISVLKLETVALKAAISTPSTVPVTVIFPVTSIPAPKSVLPGILTVPLSNILNLFAPFVSS